MAKGADFKSTFPSSEAIQLARHFADTAVKDLDNAKLMYKRKDYAHAVYLLQQSVEKSAKATGLLGAWIPPTTSSLKQVGHKSILAILLGLQKKVDAAGVALEAFRNSSTTEEYEQLGLRGLLPDFDKVKLPEAAVIQNWNREIDRLSSQEMWRRTLELRPDDPLTLTIMRELDKAQERSKGADIADAMTFKTFQWLGDLGSILYVTSLQGRCLPRVLILSIVTMWHEKTTRYPPIESSDYWNPEAYTKDKGLIKHFPLFLEHASGMAVGARIAAKAASIAEFPT